MGFYNSLVGMDVALNGRQAQIQNMYERRADLIPQLAAVVKKYAEYEKATYGEVTKFRGPANQLEALSGMVAKGDIKSDQFAGLLASTLASVKIGAEAYPDLKAISQFDKLFVEIEGSENRIRTAIMDYNTAYGEFSNKIRQFPGNIVYKLFAGSFGTHTNFALPEAGKNVKAVPNVDALLDSNK
jgi:LemA protein